PAKPIEESETDDSGEPAYTANGRSILISRRGQILSIPLAGGAPKPLTQEGINTDPVVASDSGRIAWLSAETGGSYRVRRVAVMNPDGSRAKVLTGSLDRDARDLQWSSDSRTVYFTADDQGSTRVYAARSDGTVRRVTSTAERLTSFSLADNGRAVALRS